MSYQPPQESYFRYQFLRWWCQNQWWVQIVAPCIICIGVIGALLYHWNNERSAEMQDKIGQMQYEHWKKNPPILDDELNERTAAWRVIRLKQGDPSMPIPYKKKQLIVKHWNELIVDMRPEEVQRLHDLLQDTPVNPHDDTEIDIRKFDAPWKESVSLDGMTPDSAKAVKPMQEDQPTPPSNETPASAPNSVPEANPEAAAPTENASDEKTALTSENQTPDEVAPAVEESADAPAEDVSVLLPTDINAPEPAADATAENLPSIAAKDDNSAVVLPTVEDAVLPSENTTAAVDNTNVQLPVLDAPSKPAPDKSVDKTASTENAKASSKTTAADKSKKDPKKYLPAGWKKNPLIL